MLGLDMPCSRPDPEAEGETRWTAAALRPQASRALPVQLRYESTIELALLRVRVRVRVGLRLGLGLGLGLGLELGLGLGLG